MSKPCLVFVDRDGTINKDENYFLGSKPNWKDQIEFLPGVIEGIKLLNQLSNLELFIITNQSGVALTGPEFDQLDEKRMQEVNQYIIQKLAESEAIVKGYFACPFVDSAYVKKAQLKGRTVNQKYVSDNHPDLKPRPGMILKAAKSLGIDIKDCEVYSIGDRTSDVEIGLNAGGKGILVPSFKTKELGEDVEKAKSLAKKNPGKVFIAKDFLEAAKLIFNEQK